ncbi:MAG: YpdA family putative bacillithiol disulfide reductase [Gemmatimonadota bacterium]
MNDQAVEIAVVGAGPCGLAVGAAARESGRAAVLFDRGPLCAALIGYPPYMSFFSTAEKLEVGGLPFTCSRPNPTRQEALAYFRGVARYFHLDVRQYHSVESVHAEEGGFRLTTTRADRKLEWRARVVVIATGGFHEPNFLCIPGEELPKVSHYYREAHPYWNQDVVVVGGGNSAVEASLELFRVGARVTLVHFGSELDPGVKPWLLPDIRNRISAGEVEVLWRHRIEEIRPDVVVVRSEEGGATRPIPNDWVLALTGWKPDHGLLRSLGVSIDVQTGVPSHDPETMETPVPGLFVAGVLAAGYDANRIFIENGRMHGRRIVDRLLTTRGKT